MDLTIKINLDNDAFGQDPGWEVQRILARLVKDLGNWTLADLNKSNLRDVNGNIVGRVSVK
jgi:hypothetical protein